MTALERISKHDHGLADRVLAAIDEFVVTHSAGAGKTSTALQAARSYERAKQAHYGVEHTALDDDFIPVIFITLDREDS